MDDNAVSPAASKSSGVDTQSRGAALERHHPIVPPADQQDGRLGADQMRLGSWSASQLTSVPRTHRATSRRPTAPSADTRRLDLPLQGQAIDLSNFGCGQPLELADLGIDPRHDLPRYSCCRLRWRGVRQDRKSTRLNSSHSSISYAVFCLKKKKHS